MDLICEKLGVDPPPPLMIRWWLAMNPVENKRDLEQAAADWGLDLTRLSDEDITAALLWIKQEQADERDLQEYHKPKKRYCKGPKSLKRKRSSDDE